MGLLDSLFGGQWQNPDNGQMMDTPGYFGGGGGGLLGNPLLHIGLGILGANQPGASMGQALGRGGLAGLGSYRQQQQTDYIEALKQAQTAKLLSDTERRRQIGKMLPGLLGGAPAATGASLASNPGPTGLLPSTGVTGMGGPPAASGAPAIGAGRTQPSPFAGVAPEAVRFLALGDPDKFVETMGNFALKQAERGQFVEEPRSLPGPNGQPVSVPGRRDVFTNKWEPLDPSLTRLTVNNNIAPEQAGAVQSAKDLSDIGKTYYEASQQSRRQARDLSMAGALLSRGVETGLGTETKMGIANFAKSNLGITVDPKLPDQEMFQQVGQAMAIDAAPKGQGSTSNYERELYQKAVAANMGRSTEGNKKLVEYYKRIKQQDADVGQLYENELRQSGRITPGFLTKVREHYEKPLFSEKELNDLIGMAGAGSGPSAANPLGLKLPGAK